MQRSSSHFGLAESQLDDAKGELKAAIMVAAQQRRMITYGEAASRVTVVSLDPHSSLMSHLLGEIFRDERESGRPPLTAIVTHKNGDKEPGPGFYEQAR